MPWLDSFTSTRGGFVSSACAASCTLPMPVETMKASIAPIDLPTRFFEGRPAFLLSWTASPGFFGRPATLRGFFEGPLELCDPATFFFQPRFVTPSALLPLPDSSDRTAISADQLFLFVLASLLSFKPYQFLAPLPLTYFFGGSGPARVGGPPCMSFRFFSIGLL